MRSLVNFSELEGKVFSSVKNIDDEKIIFTLVNGDSYELLHHQDCCEDVCVEDICGDLNDLVGFPIVHAIESVNEPDLPAKSEYTESYTWTFYRIATIKGEVVIRFYGTSNGYYSERVSCEFVENNAFDSIDEIMYRVNMNAAMSTLPNVDVAGFHIRVDAYIDNTYDVEVYRDDMMCMNPRRIHEFMKTKAIEKFSDNSIDYSIGMGLTGDELLEFVNTAAKIKFCLESYNDALVEAQARKDQQDN